jgi:hypothetical protein
MILINCLIAYVFVFPFDIVSGYAVTYDAGMYLCRTYSGTYSFCCFHRYVCKHVSAKHFEFIILLHTDISFAIISRG